MSLEEIQGEQGLFHISKVKILYEIGYTDNLFYMRNLDNNKFIVKTDKEKENFKNGK